jgi:cephalosporin hydroxylase
MQKIEELYKGYKSKPIVYKSKDIYEHLPVIRKYASEVGHVTEMGVRWGASTIAIGVANPKKMISYDITKTYDMLKVVSLLEASEIDFSFILGDTLNIEIEETQMLFIDTLHTYNQLSKELELHEGKVTNYIILHDTESFGRKDESIYSHASQTLKEMKKGKVGLMTAVEDFLEVNKSWVIEKHYKNNNGLTVLARI